MGKKDANKPRGRMTAYAFFVQTCREEHKRKHPGESVVFAEFSRKCAEKWKSMTPKEKKRFEEMSETDKSRYAEEMANYVPPPGSEEEVTAKKRKKKTKDPNAPKRALSGFFLFCSEQRPVVKKEFPDYSVGEIAKELGKRWEVCTERDRFDQLAKQEKARYEAEMEIYRRNGGAAGAASPSKKPKVEKPAAAAVQEEEDEAGEEEYAGDSDAE